MQNNPVSPPQKKSGFPDSEVMGAMQGKQQSEQDPQIANAQEQLQKLITENNIDPNTLIQLGDMASQALKDKSLYPIVKQKALESKIAKPEDIQEGFDYRFIGAMISSGKLAEMLVRST